MLKHQENTKNQQILKTWLNTHTHTHTHTRLTVLCPGLPRWAGTRKVKPIWILLKQETVSGSGISWNICKSAPRSRQITMPTPHHSVFYRPDALPAAQPTASVHLRHYAKTIYNYRRTTKNDHCFTATGVFCWCRVLRLACPCWRQSVHWS